MERVFSGFKQRFIKEGEPFLAKIYSEAGSLPEGFNVGIVPLDASEHSALKWEVNQDYPLILWELDLALDKEILRDEARYLALEFAIDHFTQTFWPRFKERTFGVSLYRGPYNALWLDPLKGLASHLPETVTPFLFLDVDALPDAKTYFSSINQFTLGPFTPILKGRWPQAYPYASPALAWDHPYSPLGFVSEKLYETFPERRLSKGVLLPEQGDFPLPHTHFRMIPEQILTHEWEGIDQLLTISSSVNERTKRKLLGFQAAGGEVLFTDSPADVTSPLPREKEPLSCPDVLLQNDR